MNKLSKKISYMGVTDGNKNDLMRAKREIKIS